MFLTDSFVRVSLFEKYYTDYGHKEGSLMWFIDPRDNDLEVVPVTYTDTDSPKSHVQLYRTVYRMKPADIERVTHSGRFQPSKWGSGGIATISGPKDRYVENLLKMKFGEDISFKYFR